MPRAGGRDVLGHPPLLGEWAGESTAQPKRRAEQLQQGDDLMVKEAQRRGGSVGSWAL